MLVPAVVWKNESVHVYGTGLAYPTSSRQLREELAELAEALAVETGGVAYDEQGTIGLIITAGLAATINEAMESVIQLRANGIAQTLDERGYEIGGREYWASRVRKHLHWISSSHDRNRWRAAVTREPGLPVADEEGNTTDGPERTLVVWELIEPLTRVEVRSPWQPAEMYPEVSGPVYTEPAPEETEPQLPDHVLESDRYPEAAVS
jgi:hypothetical protein